MRTRFLMQASVLPLALLLAQPAAAQASRARECDSERSSQNIHQSSNDDDQRTWRVSWESDGCSMDMRSKGNVKFSTDLSQVLSISRGGYFEITERIGSNKRHYEATPAAGGGLDEEYSVNGTIRPLDEAGKAWVRSVILELERHSGFAAEWRVGDILRKSGVDGVLNEVATLSSDYVQRRYLNVLMDSTTLNDAQVRRVLQVAGKGLSSDYELASLLISLGKKGYVKPATSADYVTAASTLQSDYERRRSLSALLKVPGLDRGIFKTILDVASDIGSDYELASLLIEMGPNGLSTSEMRTAYFNAASKLGSDYEHRRAFSALVKSPELSKELLSGILKSANDISSDYELASLLVEIAGRHELDGELRDAYIRAADGISSDHEHRRALSALIKQTGKSRL